MTLIKSAKTILGYYAVKNFIKLQWYKHSAKKYISMMPFVYDEIQTLKLIAEKKHSVARFGDGEILICHGKGIYFQEYDDRLSSRLKEIYYDDSVDNLIICTAPHVNSCFRVTARVELFIYKFFARWKETYVKLLNPDKKYGSTFISRPDAFTFGGKDWETYRDLLRMIWDQRDVLIVTGKGSRFSLIPELFNNLKSSEFLYGLSENAFDEYDELLNQIKANAENRLILLAMGPVATVLAFDLSKEGFQAIDIGHLPSCCELVKSGRRPLKTGY